VLRGVRFGSAAKERFYGTNDDTKHRKTEHPVLNPSARGVYNTKLGTDLDRVNGADVT
jgi:hypothetical protein